MKIMVREKSQANQEIIFMVDESAEGGVEAQALGFSIYTEADTLDELREAIRDAVNCHFEEKQRPAIVRLHLGNSGSEHYITHKPILLFSV